ETLVQALGDPLDPLGRRIERGGDCRLRHLRALDGRLAGVVHPGKLLLELAHALAGLDQLVGDHDRRHHQKSCIADLPEPGAQLFDAVVEILGEAKQVRLLPLLAGHAVLAAVDGYADMGHGTLRAAGRGEGRRIRIGAGHGQRSCASSTERIPSMARSSRRAISRLVASSARRRPASASSSCASFERSAPSAWICAANELTPRSESRRRSAAASSASSAAISRPVAASTEPGSTAFGTSPFGMACGAPICRSPPSARRLVRCACALGVRFPGPAYVGRSVDHPLKSYCVVLLRSAQEQQALARRNSRLSFAPIDLRPSRGTQGRRGAWRRFPTRSRPGNSLERASCCVRRGEAAGLLHCRSTGASMIAGGQDDRMANAVRALAMDAVEAAKSGHPGLPMGAADLATVLSTRFLKFDPADPAWPDRDRFVLSAGHGSMLIYAVLHLLGVGALTIEEIKRFRQLGSLTPGHPEHGHTPGIETTTGPLGQGLANAVGMAIAERHLASVFGPELVDHRTFVLASDGDLMEGISQEAIALAGHLKLAKLIVFHDDNGTSIDGPLKLADSVDQVRRFEAAGWAATRVEGHDPEAIASAIDVAMRSDRPSLIACRTVIGFGAPKKGGTEKSHGAPLGADEVAAARQKLGWAHPPFEIPADVLGLWRAAGMRARPTRDAWHARVRALSPEVRAEFERRMRGELPESALASAVQAVKQKLATAPQEVATRKASEMALEALIPALPELIGGSADLTGSNNTRIAGMRPIS